MNNYKKVIAGLAVLGVISCSTQNEPVIKQIQLPKTEDIASVTIEIDNEKQFNEIAELISRYETMLIGKYPSIVMINNAKDAYINLLKLKEQVQLTNDKLFISKIDKLIAKIEVMRREMFAGHMEKTLLDKYLSAQVRAQGKNKEVLYYKSFVVNTAFVYHFLNDATIRAGLNDLKFKKVILTNTFSTWEQPL